MFSQVQVVFPVVVVQVEMKMEKMGYHLGRGVIGIILIRRWVFFWVEREKGEAKCES